MNRNEFIKFVADIAVKDWKERRVMLPSVVIAQACKESAFGTSELAVNAKAIFGIKKNGWTGETYTKKADEQNADGTMRTDENTLWRKYDNWEQSIIDHSNYIAERMLVGQTEPNFKAVIGETNVKKVIAGLVGNKHRAETVERCTDSELRQYVKDGTTQYGYMTGLNYPQSLLDDYIIKYNLTQYDTTEEREETVSKLRVAIDAGHGLYTAGKRCMKKIDANETREWVLNSRIADKLCELLKSYNCDVLRVDDTTGKTDISLADRVNKANNWKADVYISIHHNAGVNGGSGGGIVVFYCSSKAERKAQAEALYLEVATKTGLTGNRSGKVINKGYYVIKNTDMPAFLCELGFMDSVTDVPIILSEAHADKSAQGLLNFLIKEFKLSESDQTVVAPEAQPEVIYRVQCGAFRNKSNAQALMAKLKADGYEAVIVSGTK